MTAPEVAKPPLAECWPYETRRWIAAYATGIVLWTAVAGMLGAVVVIGLLSFGVLCAASAAGALHAGDD